MKRIRDSKGHRARQQGLTMIEVMIALAIGLVLTLGAIQIFVSSKQGYRANEALARVQENGRYALHFLKRDIRNAAFLGCAQQPEVTNLTNGAGAGLSFGGPPLQGVDGASGAPDSLTLRFANQGSGMGVTQAMPTTAAALFFSSTDGIDNGQVMIVTDCTSADIFMVVTNNENNANLTHQANVDIGGVQNTDVNMSRTYGPGAIAFTFSEYTYQINNNALVRVENGTAAPLVDDIIGLELTYGVDTDNNEAPNAYVTATDINGNVAYNWDQVLAVRIRLLARSREDRIVDTPQAAVWDFDGDGALDAAPDRRMYQQFTTTVGVRNRLP